MTAVEIFIEIVVRFGQILGAPLKQPDMFWILIPIYLNWVFTDYFQERKGTDFGNAITNGVVALWVGIDWIRQLIKTKTLGLTSAAEIGVSVFFMIYGLIIMVESAKAKKIAHYIGRIREVTYVAIVFTPIFYGVIQFDLITLGAILLFFPIFYGIGEAFDRFLPAPPGEEDSLGAAPDLGGGAMPELGSSAGMPSAGMEMPGMPSGGGGMPKF